MNKQIAPLYKGPEGSAEYLDELQKFLKPGKIADFKALSSNYDLAGANDVYADITGMSLVLPTHGYYLIYGNVDCTAIVSSGSGYISVRIDALPTYDIFVAYTTGTTRNGTGFTLPLIANESDIPKTIKFQARSYTASGVWTTKRLTASGIGTTTFGYLYIGKLEED